MALTRCPFSSCPQQSIVLMCIISDQHFSLVGNITLIPLLFSCLPQNISTGLAIAGVIVIARSIKLVREKDPQMFSCTFTLLIGVHCVLSQFDILLHKMSFFLCFSRMSHSVVLFHLCRSQNFKLRVTSPHALLRGTSAFVGKSIRSQRKDLKWSMSQFICLLSLHYFQSIRVIRERGDHESMCTITPEIHGLYDSEPLIYGLAA